MNRRTLLAGMPALALLPVPALAQEKDEPTETITVSVGAYDFPVDPNQALTAYVVGREETLEGVYVTLQLLARHEAGNYVPLAEFTTRATAALAEAHVDTPLILSLGA
jgi:hypothetical protein